MSVLTDCAQLVKANSIQGKDMHILILVMLPFQLVYGLQIFWWKGTVRWEPRRIGRGAEGVQERRREGGERDSHGDSNRQKLRNILHHGKVLKAIEIP